MDFEIKQIITQIFAFLLMLWLLKRYLWKPLLGLMDERAKKIQDSFDEITAKNHQIDLRTAEYEEKIRNIKQEGQAIIQQAVKKGQKTAHDLQIESHKKAMHLIEKAQEEIERENEKAKVQLKKEIVDLTFQAFEKLVHLKMTPEEKERFSLHLIEKVQ
jgi:F-type H+-transporting ATPase subunit b